MGILFQNSEISAMEKDPNVLRALADWHDIQICEGEAMGYDCSFNIRRSAALREEASKFAAEWGID